MPKYPTLTVDINIPGGKVRRIKRKNRSTARHIKIYPASPGDNKTGS
jgi:hypothetical protein